MCEEFDIYYAGETEIFRQGDVVRLDGIDGFFDQHFDGLPPGSIERFAVLYGKPAEVPASIDELNAMPFVEGRVTRSDMICGDVEIRSLTTLGQWIQSRELVTQPLAWLRENVTDVPILELVGRALQDGAVFWRGDVRRWLKLDGTSVVYAVRDGADVRVVALRDNACPSIVARVHGSASD